MTTNIKGAAMTNPTSISVEAYDAAVEAELARVSHVEYDSHEICKHFALKLRDRLEPPLRSCAQKEQEAGRWRHIREHAIGFELDPRNEGIIFGVALNNTSLEPTSIDAAIDAAIAKESP
jgi:hypothetical protein